jgi:FAD/FMN-containing dehydrogenase
MIDKNLLSQIASEIEGDFFTDKKMLVLYATDASVYKEYPLAVAYPKNNYDIQKIIKFCYQNNVPLIPRAAGTSLGGQVVGNGIVIDISKYLNKIIEINEAENWAIVQPGVVRDELNHHLKKYNLYFGPETSTANRAMLGGMVGNNSCGTNSIVYGSTRNHVLEIKGFLSNGERNSRTCSNSRSVERKN